MKWFRFPARELPYVDNELANLGLKRIGLRGENLRGCDRLACMVSGSRTTYGFVPLHEIETLATEEICANTVSRRFPITKRYHVCDNVHDTYDPDTLSSHATPACHCQNLLAGHSAGCAYHKPEEQRGVGLWGIKRQDAKTHAEINAEHTTHADYGLNQPGLRAFK